MIYSFNINLLVSVIIAMIVVVPIFYAISMLRTGNNKNRKTWKHVTVKSTLSGEEFIGQVKNICIQRNYELLEISPTHAYIKQNMSFSTGGMLYYVELNCDGPDTVTVWARGSILKNGINLCCVTGMANLFYTI